MATSFDMLLRPTRDGLYCAAGGFFVDPVRPVERAVITHGHSDHARSGHGAVLATKETLAIMAARYGEAHAARIEALAYGERRTIGDVAVTLAPAGHVLGSAQVVLEHGGKRVVVSGDYKRRRDPTCPPFEPISCDVFVTEATFALPVFCHPDASDEIGKLLTSMRQFPERTHVVGAYALGKAQRIITLAREAGYDEPIYIHGALKELCDLYGRFGVDLGPLEAATEDKPRKDKFAGALVIAPPSALGERWTRRFSEPLSAFASGWMRIRARARQRLIELPLIISDHADWGELTDTIKEIAPGEVWVTHGRDDALLRWAKLEGVAARPLRIEGYEDEAE